MKKLSHLIEFILIKTALIIFGCLSFSSASSIGGAIGRFIGPKLGVTKTARNNIKMAMPELSAAEVEAIIIGMWDNLGRVATEFSQMHKKSSKLTEFITIEGQENLALLASNTPFLLISGHIANWELLPQIFASQGHLLHIVYRKANNPYIDRLIYKTREKYLLSASAKSSIGARQLIRSLQNNGKIIMLVDQKQNDGISVPFFGMPAMTAPGVATMSLKYNASIMPVRIIRTSGHKFRCQLCPPIIIQKTGDNTKDTQLIMAAINNQLEEWIRQHPNQWFWVHNRWKKPKPQ